MKMVMTLYVPVGIVTLVLFLGSLIGEGRIFLLQIVAACAVLDIVSRIIDILSRYDKD